MYWQESGDTIHITIQGLQYDILRYIAILYARRYNGIFLILGIGYIFRKAVIKSTPQYANLSNKCFFCCCFFNQNTLGSAFAIISHCNIQHYWTTFCAVRVKRGKLKCLQNSLVKCMYKMYLSRGGCYQKAQMTPHFSFIHRNENWNNSFILQYWQRTILTWKS